MRVTTMIGQGLADRLGQVSEVGAEVAGHGVAGADLGERAQRLGRARVDGGREREERQEDGGRIRGWLPALPA